MARSQPQHIEAPAVGKLSDGEREQIGQAIQERIRSQAPPPQEAQPQAQPAVVKGELIAGAKPTLAPPSLEIPKVIIEPAYEAEIREEAKEKMRAAMDEYYSLSKRERAARQDQYHRAFTWLMKRAPEELLKYKLTNEDRALVEKRIKVLKPKGEEAKEEAQPAEAGVPRGAEARVEQPPREPEKLKKWLAAKVIGRAAFGVLSWVQGLALPYTLEQYRKQLVARRKTSEEVEMILKEIESSITPQMREAAREGAWFIPVAEQKVEELRAKVDRFVADGQISPKRRDQILGEFGAITMKHAKETTPTRERYLKDSAQALGDYLEKTVSKTQLLRAGIDTSLFVTGNFFARGLTYLTLAPVERALRQKREYELDLRARVLREGEEYTPAFLEKVKGVVWERTVKDGVAEFLRSAAGKGATKEREASRWCRFIDRVRAFGMIARLVGISSAAATDWGRLDVSEGAEEFLKAWEEKGPAALYESFLRGTARVYHVTLEGERGYETLEPAHKEASAIKPISEAEAVAIAEEAREASGVQFLKTHGVVQLLVDRGKAELTIAPDGAKELTLNLDESKGGFAEVQQALRRLFGQYAHTKENRLTDTDADRIEKMIKITKHVLNREHIPSRLLDKGYAVPTNLPDIVHYDAQGNVAVDLERFEKELIPALEQAADHYHVSMMAYINNTSHRVWQSEIADARAGTEGRTIVVDDFDRSASVHQAEIQEAQHTVKSLGIPGLEVVSDKDVTDESTFVAHLGDRVVPVEDGAVSKITTSWQGHEYVHTLSQPIDIDHPYADSDLRGAFNQAYTAAIKEFGGEGEAAAAAAAPGGGAVEAPEFQLERGPILGESRNLAEVLTHAVERHGRLEIGGVPLKAEWLEHIRDKNVIAFAKEPLRVAGLHFWDQWSAQGQALRALAQVIKHHPDSGTTEDFFVRHEEQLDGWMREVRV